MENSDPNNNKMSVEKIEGGMIQLRKGFSEPRATGVEQTEVLDNTNTAMYKLEQRVSDIRKVFLKG